MCIRISHTHTCHARPFLLPALCVYTPVPRRPLRGLRSQPRVQTRRGLPPLSAPRSVDAHRPVTISDRGLQRSRYLFCLFLRHLVLKLFKSDVVSSFFPLSLLWVCYSLETQFVLFLCIFYSRIPPAHTQPLLIHSFIHPSIHSIYGTLACFQGLCRKLSGEKCHHLSLPPPPCPLLPAGASSLVSGLPFPVAQKSRRVSPRSPFSPPEGRAAGVSLALCSFPWKPRHWPRGVGVLAPLHSCAAFVVGCGLLQPLPRGACGPVPASRRDALRVGVWRCRESVVSGFLEAGLLRGKMRCVSR